MRMLHRHESQSMSRATSSVAAIHIAFWAIWALGVLSYLLLYGDPRLAVGTLDTPSYIDFISGFLAFVGCLQWTSPVHDQPGL